MGLESTFRAIRDALIADLIAAFPEVTKIHKVAPELLQDSAEVPYGWVIRNSPLARADARGGSRNQKAFTVTFNLGIRLAKPAGTNIDDERIAMAERLFDQLTATAHHGEGYLEDIVELLIEPGQPNDQFIEVDCDWQVEFVANRADAV